MNQFIELEVLSVSVDKDTERKHLVSSRITDSGFCTNTINININQIIFFSTPIHESFYYRDYSLHEDKYVGLDVFKIKTSDGSIYFIDKKLYKSIYCKLKDFNNDKEPEQKQEIKRKRKK